MRISAHATRRLYRRALAPALLILLGACAQQREPGYYQPAAAGTASDAMHRAQGGTDIVAPAQIQLGFGPDTRGNPPQAGGRDSADTPAAQTPAATPAPLADTHTYLGTVPCAEGMQCPASRMTLTLAPDGQWRARSVTVDTAKTSTRMGCWYLTSDKPLRILLQIGERTRAQMEFASNSTLRVLMVDGHRPLLDYTLTRQADIDPIDELSGHPAQACTRPGEG
ncbi:copper resistance protein NlpE N-terminal domain-containing protein [Castellaniella sp. GW247-6E4]|uniref:copper resistance protein NlpE N-terminal domain-containing protein n=1 Tax=Castellaniella sp. GW247-6E4 TaxID=3140380 RepID=UPI003315A70A